MVKNLVLSGCALLMMGSSVVSFAHDVSCEVQIAVASPPIQRGQSVAFNIVNEVGVNKSFILEAGNPYKVVTNLSCLPTPYSISATLFEPGTLQAIGQCNLKVGFVLLKDPNSSAAAVFPYDFDCH
ncbi:hypothetical protein ELY15_03625 [Legionella sp. km772]|nr:hypothetical protein ELY15_03625 [Legionella sp. km772]